MKKLITILYYLLGVIFFAWIFYYVDYDVDKCKQNIEIWWTIWGIIFAIFTFSYPYLEKFLDEEKQLIDTLESNRKDIKVNTYNHNINALNILVINQIPTLALLFFITVFNIPNDYYRYYMAIVHSILFFTIMLFSRTLIIIFCKNEIKKTEKGESK